MQRMGRGHAVLLQRKLWVHVKIYSYMNRFLSSNESNGVTSFKINVLKQRFIILFLASPALHTLCISLSLSLSLIQIVRSAPTVPIIHLFSHSYEKPYTWMRMRLLCCIKALIRIKRILKANRSSSIYK